MPLGTARSAGQMATSSLMPCKTPAMHLRTTKHMKQVSYATATTYYFPLEYGGSAVPKEHGPPIGLAKTHSRQECINLKHHTPKRSRVRKFDHVERMMLLQEKASYTQRQVAMFCFEAIAIRRSRLETEDDEIEADTKEREVPEREPKRRKIQS